MPNIKYSIEIDGDVLSWNKCDYTPNSYEVDISSVDTEKLDKEISKGLINILKSYNKDDKGVGCDLTDNDTLAEAHKIFRLEKKDNKYYAYLFGIVGPAIKDETGKVKFTCSERSGYAFVLDKDLNVLNGVYPNVAGYFTEKENKMFPSDLETIYGYSNYQKQYDELEKNYKDQLNKYFE